MIVGSDQSSVTKLSRAERKAQGAAETVRAKKEMRAGMMAIGSVVVLILASIVYQVLGGGGPPAQRIDVLPTTDAAKLRAILFGAEPWVIECSGSGESLLRVAAGQRLLPDGLRAGRLDCAAPLPAGLSLLKRFKLSPPSSGRPLLLQAGHGLPAPLPVGKQPSAPSLVRHLKRWVQPHVTLLNSTLDLRRHCLSRPACLLLLTVGATPSSAKNVLLKAVGNSLRHLGVCALNRRTHAASFTKQLPETSRAVLLALRATSAPLSAEARAFRGAVSSDNQLEVESFVATAVKGEGFTALETPPRVAPADEGSASGRGESLASEELFDPLLSQKRYEREIAL